MFDGDEWFALYGLIPMTYELFCSIMMTYERNGFYEESEVFALKYPEYLIKYADSILEKINMLPLPIVDKNMTGTEKYMYYKYLLRLFEEE